MLRIAVVSLIFIAALNVVDRTSAVAATIVYVGQQQSALVSIDEIDHSPWDELLKKYVNSDGRVDYAGWKANAADVIELDEYLKHLSSASHRVNATRDARLAFWINAYNAVTIRGILREYPTTSIRNHTARLFGYNIWKHLQLYVGGDPVSLEHIEHEILRKMNEPRIHFAIVCASNGCPRLMNEAYRSERIEDQLETNTKDFFSRAQNFQHDVGRKRFLLSAIIDWFEDDFGADQTAQLRMISKWLPTSAAKVAAENNTVSVSYLDYDWQLNKQ